VENTQNVMFLRLICVHDFGSFFSSQCDFRVFAPSNRCSNVDNPDWTAEENSPHFCVLKTLFPPLFGQNKLYPPVGAVLHRGERSFRTVILFSIPLSLEFGFGEHSRTPGGAEKWPILSRFSSEPVVPLPSPHFLNSSEPPPQTLVFGMIAPHPHRCFSSCFVLFCALALGKFSFPFFTPSKFQVFQLRVLFSPHHLNDK